MSSQNINGQSQLVQDILQVAYSKEESNTRYYRKYFPGISKDQSSYSAKQVDDLVQGGSGSNGPLNTINLEYPLTDNLDFSQSQYHVKGTDPIQSNDMAIKSWTEDQINNHYPNKIVALGNPQNNAQIFQNGFQVSLQNNVKELIQDGITTDFQVRKYDQDYQIIDENQLVTYKQTILTTDAKIEEEKKERQAADTNLQNQITSLHDTPLNLWPTPMTPGIQGNTFEMNGNQISGLGMQVINTMPGDYAASIDYVNTSINTLASNVVGQIANVKVQCNTYTDQEIFNLETQTQIDLAAKQDIVPLNELPVPITALNMNGKRITNLAQPAFVDGDLDAIPKGYADLRYATKTELADYITIQNANDAFRSRISTLSDIQLEEPAPLNMQNLRITNCADAINPTDVPTYQQVINGQGISQEYADTHYLSINIPLDQINPPIGPVSMNGQQLIDLPSVPISNSCAITSPWAEGIANQAVRNPVQNIDMSLTHKVTGLPMATQPSDAVRFDQLPNLNDYLTITQADTLYMAKNESLSGIQTNNPQELDMQSQKITGLALATEPSDAVRFDQLPTVNPGDEIVNASGNSYVKVNANETISMSANDDEILRVEQTQVVVSQPIFSTTVPAFDPSNQLLTKNQNALFFMDKYTTLNNIPFAEGDISTNGFQVRDLPQPTESHMAANKGYVDQVIDQNIDHIQNSSNQARVQTNSDSSVSIKANNSSSSFVFTANGNQYTLSNDGNINIQTNGILTLNPTQYIQATTPIISNSNTTTSQYQVLNRNQNDARYYQNNVSLNEITKATSDVDLNGFSITNCRDAISSLEVTNLAQVQDLIANSGFKNKIQSTSGHAQVICQNGSDNVEIKANNANSSLNISANDTTYNIENTGIINLQTSDLNVNQNALRVIGNGGGSTITLAGDLRSSALDLDFPDQILTRAQNDSRYLNSQTTNLATIPPPDASVSFGNQLLRNLQTPILGTDASTKAYIDSSLTNYPTTSVLQSNYVSKSDASSTYRTEQQVQTQIEANLQNYDTSLAVTDKISTALVPYSTSSQIASTYLTQANASSTYQRQDTPFTQILNGLNSVEAQTNNSGLKFYAGLSGIKTNILDIFHPQGQPSGTSEIQGKGRLNIVSNLGLTSIMSGVGQNVSTVTIKSASDTPNAIQYDNLVIGSRNNCPSLQLSSGHDASGNGYSLINNAVAVSANTLQLSPEISTNVISGNNLLMYGNATPITIKNQFNKNVGLTFTQTSPQSNEFVTKSYCDATYSGGVQTTIQDSTQAYRVICTNGNVQLYTALNSGQPSIYFRKSLDGTYTNYTEIANVNSNQGLLLTLPTVFTQTPQINASQILSQASGDSRYLRQFNAYLNEILPPQGDYSLGGFKFINLSAGTIASGNTSSITGGDVYNYLTSLPSVITEQVYTVTIFGSTTNGFLFSSLPNTPQNNVVQVQRVKGSGALMITSSTVIAQSQTLVDSFASLQLQVSNPNVRVTQCVPYTTTAFSTPGQQNIASLTFSQQAINSTNTCIQLYKPVSNQGSSAFILYVYVDQF